MWFACPRFGCVTAAVSEHSCCCCWLRAHSAPGIQKGCAPVSLKHSPSSFSQNLTLLEQERRSWTWFVRKAAGCWYCLVWSLLVQWHQAWVLTLDCLSVHSMRCQSLLHMAMFRYKRDTAIKYSRILNDHFKVGHLCCCATSSGATVRSGMARKTNKSSLPCCRVLPE